MGNYEQLKEAIKAVIKTNGNQEITGQVMQDTLLAITSSFGQGALFAGIATPETNPLTPDQNVFYLTSTSGVYPNFNGLSVADGEIVVFSLSNGQWVKQLLSLGGGGSVTIINEPDEEDLTTVPESAENNVIRFKTRLYDEASASGKGYKIIRKYWKEVNGVRKNILTQDVINDANTIYEIRYDFDLDGAEIQIKEGCVLKFVGGSLSNGTINCIKLEIASDAYKIFDENIIIKGDLNVDFVFPEWFGAVRNGIDDDSLSIKKAIYSVPNGGTIRFLNGVYFIDTSNKITPLDNQVLIGSGNTKFKSKFTINAYQIIDIFYKKNVSVENIQIEGDKEEHSGSGGVGIGIAVSSSENVHIKNCYISSCYGDGIVLGGKKQNFNINISNTICDGNCRNGISITHARNVIIENSKFINSSGTSPECGIDIEPNTGETVENVIINASECRGNRSGIDVLGYANYINNLSVFQTKCYNNSDFGLSLGYLKYAVVNDCAFFNNGQYGVQLSTSNENVSVLNSVICNSGKHGIYIHTIEQSLPRITKNILIENCIIKNNSSSNLGIYDGIHVSIDKEYYKIEDIHIVRCNIFDDSEVKTQRYGLFVQNSDNINRFFLCDCKIHDNKDGNISELKKTGYMALKKIEYKVFDNAEITITDIDDTTHDFITSDIIPTVGTKIMPVFNTVDAAFLNVLPNGISNNIANYYISEVNGNKFKISKKTGGASLNITKTDTTNLAKWHFEYNFREIQFDTSKFLNKKKFHIEIKGKTPIFNGYLFLISINEYPLSTLFYEKSKGNVQSQIFLTDAKGAGDVLSDFNIDIDSNSFLSVDINGIGAFSNSSNSFDFLDANKHFFTTGIINVDIEKIRIRSCEFANGTTVCLYEK